MVATVPREVMTLSERPRRTWLAAGCVPAAAAVLVGCTSTAAAGEGIVVSGSSTVAPITQRIALEGRFAVDVAEEGTTAGFERFCTGESDINNASEAIPGAGQPVDYVQLCADNGVEFIELPIALDALSVVRHVDNDFATDLTLAELRAIWEPGSTVTTWRDVRAEWPEEEVRLAGRPPGSGTFDYFTHHVTGEVGAIREDYRATNDLDELASWIAEEPYGLGFMGVGNYLAADEEARDVLTTVAVDGVEPSLADAQQGRYQPLTRPLFIYVSVEALAEDEEVARFVEHYLQSVEEVLPRVYFYGLPTEAYDLVAGRFAARTPGTLYGGDPYTEIDLLEALRAG